MNYRIKYASSNLNQNKNMSNIIYQRSYRTKKKKSVASIQESKIFCIQYSNITIKQF